MKAKPLPDINLLPPDYRRPPFTQAGLVVVLVTFLALALLTPLLEAQDQARSMLSSREARLETLQAEEEELLAQEPSALALRDNVEKQEKRLKELEEDYKTFQAERVDWPRALETFLAQLPSGMDFKSFTQKDKTTLEVVGSALDAQQVASYVRQLVQVGFFSSVKFGHRQVNGGVEFTLLVQAPGEAQ